MLGTTILRKPSYKDPYKKIPLAQLDPGKKKLGPTRAILNSNPFTSGVPLRRRFRRCRQPQMERNPVFSENRSAERVAWIRQLYQQNMQNVSWTNN